MNYEFKGKVIRWAANPSFYLVTVPKKYFKEISEVSEVIRRGWGAVRVDVMIGRTAWQTSIFPESDGTYVLPLKKEVRKAEHFDEGDTIFVQLTLVDF